MARVWGVCGIIEDSKGRPNPSPKGCFLGRPFSITFLFKEVLLVSDKYFPVRKYFRRAGSTSCLTTSLPSMSRF